MRSFKTYNVIQQQKSKTLVVTINLKRKLTFIYIYPNPSIQLSNWKMHTIGMLEYFKTNLEMFS